MRRVVIPVSPVVMAGLLMGHPMSKVVTDLPSDTEVYGARWEPNTHRILLDATSSEFEEVIEGSFAPEFTPTITASWDENSAILDMLRPVRAFVWLDLAEGLAHAFEVAARGGGASETFYARPDEVATHAACGRALHTDMTISRQPRCQPCVVASKTLPSP